MKNRILSIFFCIAAILPMSAQGDLLISPTRVVFEDGKQNQELFLINTGQDTTTYTVSFIQHRALDNGGYERIEHPDEGQHFSSDFVRYFPRKFTLAPNEPQTLRMQFRRRPNLIDGEYRSHLYFRSEPMEQHALGGDIGSGEGEDGISIKLIPIYGISIPIIVRNGETSVNVTSSELNWEMKTDSTASLKFTFFREGNISVFGDINILYDGPGSRSSILYKVKGVAVHTPNKLRNFEYEIPVPKDLPLNGATITLRYFSSNDNKPNTYITKKIRL